MKKVTVLALFIGVTSLICPVQASVACMVNSGIYYRGDFIDDPVLILLPGQQGAIEKSFVRDGVDNELKSAGDRRAGRADRPRACPEPMPALP